MSETQWLIAIAEEGRDLKAQVRAKTISVDDAMKALRQLENAAWKDCPNTEPDGDITYAVASAADEIRTLNL